MQSVEQQVLKVEEAITRVEVEIQIAADNITNAKSDRDKDRWWGKKKLLREKEKLLREEEKLLRAEKASLRNLKRGISDTEDSANKRMRSEAVDNKRLVSFWENLKDAVIEETQDGTFLQLKEGTYFLGLPAYLDKLYVRQEYKIVSDLLDSLHTTETGVAVIGTPGVGKSMFGYWLMHKWALQGRRIVLRKKNFQAQAYILFSSEGIFEITGRDLLTAILDDPETRYSVDGIDPSQYPAAAKMVLVTLPDENIYHEFLKPGGYVQRYMDLWNAEEIELLRKSMYKHVTPEECQSRMERWGPVPRYVLEKGDYGEQLTLEMAIARCDLHRLKAAEGTEFAVEVIHQVVHLRVKPNSRHCGVVAIFASDFVAQSIFDQLWITESSSIEAWVSAGTSSSELGALRGIFYEQACHRIICRGGSFEVREAADPTRTQTLHISSSTLRKVDDWSEAAQASADTYCQARKRNMATIDAIQQPGRMFQMTVSKKHSINCAGLRSASNAMRSKLAAKIYFVVPPDQYPHFKPRPIDKGPGVAELSKIEQWVLKMPLGES